MQKAALKRSGKILQNKFSLKRREMGFFLPRGTAVKSSQFVDKHATKLTATTHLERKDEISTR